MKIKIFLILSALFVLVATSCCTSNCDTSVMSNSGVEQATVKVETDVNGHTAEQNNIMARYKNDNKVGAIKYLYVISAYSGQTILFSAVKGKVTSAGKRLTPTSVEPNSSVDMSYRYNQVVIAGKELLTSEVIQDDGTYGQSDPYIYWFDTKGIYHQHYLSGGQIVHVSDAPLNVKSIIINMETSTITPIPADEPKEGEANKPPIKK